MHFSAPPPSYDQALDFCPAPQFEGGHSNPVGAAPVPELSEKMLAQAELIREQEAEIGKLRRDLGRLRDQLGKVGPNQLGERQPDKLAQRLAASVDEEAEEKRRKMRSRKGDILRGTFCCIALLAVLLAGLYVFLSRPSPAAATKPSLEHFQVLGKGPADALCWAKATVLPGSQVRNCHIFRRSLEDPRLFCEFALGQEEGRQSTLRKGGFTSRRKGLIVMEQRQRDETTSRQRRDGNSAEAGPLHLLLHTLNDEQAREARNLCTERVLPRLGRPVLSPELLALKMSTHVRSVWNRRFNGRIVA